MKVWLSLSVPAIAGLRPLVVALVAVAYTALQVSYTSSVCVNFAGFPWHFPQNLWPRSLRVSARYTVLSCTFFFLLFTQFQQHSLTKYAVSLRFPLRLSILAKLES